MTLTEEQMRRFVERVNGYAGIPVNEFFIPVSSVEVYERMMGRTGYAPDTIQMPRPRPTVSLKALRRSWKRR